MTSAFFILVEAKKVDSLSVIKLGRFVVHSVAKRVKIMKINFSEGDSGESVNSMNI